jgi:O-antigen ligase
VSRAIIDAPRWLLLGAIVFAPWAYGSTAPWAIQILQFGLGAICLLWFGGAVLRRQAPAFPKTLLATVIFLLLQGWWMAINAKYDYPTSDGITSSFQSEALDPWAGWAPGSVHSALSWAAMVQVSVLLVILLMIGDLAQRSLWRKRLWWTMAGAGASIALLGIVQRITSAPAIFWTGAKIQDHFFSTFRNFDNAAAFLNIVWPLLAGLFLLELREHGRHWQKVVLGLGAALCLCGVLVSGSRTASLLAVAMLLAWMVWIAVLAAKRELGAVQPTTVVVSCVLVLLLLGALAVLAGHDLSWQRWSQFDRQLTASNSRLLAYRACVGMMPESGWWGFGPGTFQTAFPYFTHEFGKQLGGRWLYAHQDYLQTIVEWGYLGATAWAVLLVGGVGTVVRRAFRHRRDLSFIDRVTVISTNAALGGVMLHALVDFPLQVASIQLYVVVLLGTFWGSRRWLAVPEKRTHSRRATKPVKEVQFAP